MYLADHRMMEDEDEGELAPLYGHLQAWVSNKSGWVMMHSNDNSSLYHDIHPEVKTNG